MRERVTGEAPARVPGIPTPLGSRYLPRVDFRVLGPIEVVGPEGSVALGGPKQRAVLAHLLIAANRLVTTDSVIDAVWPDDPPDAPKTSLRSYVSNLRKALGPSRIEGRAPGYLLRVDPDEVDAMRFESLVRAARRHSDDPTRAAALLHDALALWRGPAFADLEGLRSLEGEVARLEELRLSAIEERIAAELASGRQDEPIGELELLVRQHPLRERLWAHLMLARYRAGRQADALSAFEHARGILSEELGIDPSPELRRLHEQVLRQDPALELRGQPLRGYRLLERIGEGAYGVVHRALQPQVGREVAIKSIHPELANDPDFVRGFEREAQLVARLEHPHVVPLYDYWREPDAAYLVMRFLRGGSLRARLARDDALSPDEVATLLDQIGDALATAHQQGIVHRDVKPENVLLDEEARAYLTDFGIAKDLAGSRTTRSGALGTPAYLSPEQIRGEQLTPSADVYALGVLLYEVLTGRHPFPEGSIATLIQHHLNDPLPSLLPIRPELSSGVDAVIARATAKDPALRFADAPSLAAAFRAALGRFATAPSRIPALRIANPYKGLRPFDEADSPDFFGRDALVHRLLSRLGGEGPGSRLLAVVGPSGSGKSSVVAAGLLPALRRGDVPGSEGWFYAVMTPGAHPADELEGSLLRVAIDPPASLIEQLERDELGLLRAVKRLLPDDGSELVLVIDQLEELFTLTDDERTRSHFLASIAAAVSDPNSRLRVIATLRADFYDRPLLHPVFGQLLGARTETVTPLAPDDLERAIAGPAERMGIQPEPALVAEMVADVTDEPGALPLLQYALTELFDRREDRSMTVSAYHEIGGVSGALAKRAEDLFAGLDDEGQRACRQLFLHLVALGEGTEDTRRRVTRSELDTLEVDHQTMDHLIEAFGAHRLLSFDRDPVTRGPTVELAHEALIRAWARFRSWIDEARDDVRALHRLATAAAEWETSGQETGFLLAGSRLAQFETWSDASQLAMPRREREYLKASLEHRDAEGIAERERMERERSLERRSVRRMRWLVAVVAAAALVAASLTAIATNQRDRAERSARETHARELALAADANLDVDPELSVLLAIEAAETTLSVDGSLLREAEEALHRAVQAQRITSTIPGIGGADYLLGGERLVGFAPAGSTLTSGDATGGQASRVAWIIDATTGDRLMALEEHTAAITDVSVSPQESLIATSGLDGLTAIWDPETGALLRTLHDEEGTPTARVAFSPDGVLLATGAARAGHGVVTIWNTASWRPVAAFGPHVGGVQAIAWAPDSSRLAVVPVGERSRGTFVAFKVWVAQTGRLLHSPIQATSSFGADFTEPLTKGATWGPDGASILTVGGAGTLDTWDAESGVRLDSFPVDGALLTDLSLAPDGSLLATGGQGGTKVWRMTPDGPARLLELATTAGTVGRVSLSPDGTHLAVGSEDGATRIWDISVSGGREWLTLPSSNYLPDVVFSPGGTRLALSGADVSVAIHDATTGELIETVEVDPGDVGNPSLLEVVDLAFSPDGSRLAAAVGNSGLVLDLDAGGPPVRLGPFVGEANGIDFSPDGSRVVTTNWETGNWSLDAPNHTLRVYDSRTGEQLWQHQYLGLKPRFGPGGLVSTTGPDGTVRLWEAGSGELLNVLIDIEAFSAYSAFSSNGDLLAAGLFDGTARIWDVASGRELQTLRGGNTWSVAFNPEGSLLATGHTNGNIRIWDVSTGRELLILSGHQNVVDHLNFSPDGSRLASGSYDGTVRVWLLEVADLMEVAHERLTRAFTGQECQQYRIDPCPIRDPATLP